MKLTNYIREAFVRSAMNDVPEVDYQELATKLVVGHVVSTAPAAIQKAIKAGSPESDWVGRSYLSMPGSLRGVYVPGPHATRGNFPQPVLDEIKRLDEALSQQMTQRKELESNLTAAAKSVTTRAALVTLLPEFEKYLPANEQAACKTLPAVANIMAGFVNAGWPKDSKPSKVAK